MVAALTPFGTLADGRTVQAATISAGSLQARILTYGARLQSLWVEGLNVVAGSDDLTAHETHLQYAGPIIGPVLNRIAGARAQIDGREHLFEANQDDAHCLHSGSIGTHHRIWRIVEQDAASVTLQIELADGLGGFPGNRSLRSHYSLSRDALTVGISATTDALTLMNPGLHGVWNLDGSENWRDHRLQIPARTYLPVTEDILPTGEIAAVAGPFDLREARTPSSRIDHNYCFTAGMGLRATLLGAAGLAMRITSDAPGLQVYTGSAQGIALEPQMWPDAPHHASFPSILLRPGQVFSQTSVYRFART